MDSSKVKQELTREDAYWAGSFDWTTVLQPGDGRKRDAWSLAAQSNWVLHHNTHIFWHLHLTNYTRWDWKESEWNRNKTLDAETLWPEDNNKKD